MVARDETIHCGRSWVWDEAKYPKSRSIPDMLTYAMSGNSDPAPPWGDTAGEGLVGEFVVLVAVVTVAVMLTMEVADGQATGMSCSVLLFFGFTFLIIQDVGLNHLRKYQPNAVLATHYSQHLPTIAVVNA